MLPFGHLGASYLLTQLAKPFKKRLFLKEILLILFAGIILDFDIFAGIALDKSHHDLVTHTPFGAVIVWLILILIFRNISLLAKLLTLASLLSHLVLDEIGYWFYVLNLQAVINQPQISWLYPLRPLFDRSVSSSFYSIGSFIWIYLNNAKANILLEIIFFGAALLMLWLNRKNSKR